MRLGLLLLLLGLQDADNIPVQTLMDNLGSLDIAEREDATRQLLELGNRVEPTLKMATRQKDPEIRARSRWILGKIGVSRGLALLCDLEKKLMTTTSGVVRFKATGKSEQLGNKWHVSWEGDLYLGEGGNVCLSLSSNHLSPSIWSREMQIIYGTTQYSSFLSNGIRSSGSEPARRDLRSDLIRQICRGTLIFYVGGGVRIPLPSPYSVSESVNLAWRESLVDLSVIRKEGGHLRLTYSIRERASLGKIKVSVLLDGETGLPRTRKVRIPEYKVSYEEEFKEWNLEAELPADTFEIPDN